jgi:hypothetical protein
MSQDDGYFGEEVAATYDEASTDMFDEGTDRRHGPCGSLGRLGSQPLYARKHTSRIGVAEGSLPSGKLMHAFSADACHNWPLARGTWLADRDFNLGLVAAVLKVLGSKS